LGAANGYNPGVIRPLRRQDIPLVSALIQNTVLVSNSGDYDLKVIGALVDNFSHAGLRSLAARRRMFVYERGGRICGVVGLEGEAVCNLFVAPDEQGRGIGQELLEHVESMAREQGLTWLTLDSSLTAVGFYERLGYRKTGEQSSGRFGDTVRMDKRL
jgi:GNAT superfamily N-acetyltransferase